MKVTNISKALQGVKGKSGAVYILPARPRTSSSTRPGKSELVGSRASWSREVPRRRRRPPSRPSTTAAAS